MIPKAWVKNVLGWFNPDIFHPCPVDLSAPPLAIETMSGYARSIGTALWYKLGRDRGKVGGQESLD
jgi:hypothetical protein